MKSSPYRVAAPRPERSREDPTALLDDRELLPVFSILWISSVARVVLGVWRGEPFATELTLACAAVLLVPFVARNAVASLLRRRAPRP